MKQCAPTTSRFYITTRIGGTCARRAMDQALLPPWSLAWVGHPHPPQHANTSSCSRALGRAATIHLTSCKAFVTATIGPAQCSTQLVPFLALRPTCRTGCCRTFCAKKPEQVSTTKASAPALHACSAHRFSTCPAPLPQIRSLQSWMGSGCAARLYEQMTQKM